MFDMIGAALICVREDREVQDSIGERLTLPDNLRWTSEPIEVILSRGKSGLDQAKTPGVWARL